jgi:hypothetical protein
MRLGAGLFANSPWAEHRGEIEGGAPPRIPAAESSALQTLPACAAEDCDADADVRKLLGAEAEE